MRNGIEREIAQNMTDGELKKSYGELHKWATKGSLPDGIIMNYCEQNKHLRDFSLKELEIEVLYETAKRFSRMK